MTGKRKGIRLGKMVVLAFAALSGSALAKPVMDDKQKCKAAIASYFELSGREVNARISVSEQRKSGDYLVTFKKSMLAYVQLSVSYQRKSYCLGGCAGKVWHNGDVLSTG